MLRSLSLFLRKRSTAKKNAAVLAEFEKWKSEIENFVTIHSDTKNLAIIRLDDIGDYLLYRNFIGAYKKSNRFASYKITLIGNIVWKPIFEAFDAAAVDEVVWVDKHKYFSDHNYRTSLWKEINALNCSVVISPSRTRPLLIDDMIALATGAKEKIAGNNSFAFEQWNTVSDKIYTQLFEENKQQHEFHFNQSFSNAVTTGIATLEKPVLPLPENQLINPRQVICFIGASAKSKTWPLVAWVELIKKLLQNGFDPLLAGGKNEGGISERIIFDTGVASITGKTNLTETLQAIAFAGAVITGDTMAAHAAVAYAKPTIILANGVNANRFAAYKDKLQIDNIVTLYTKPYKDFLKNSGDPLLFDNAITSDMQTITVDEVMTALLSLR